MKCAIAKHVRLANVTANTELKTVRTNTAVEAGVGGLVCCIFLSLLL